MDFLSSEDSENSSNEDVDVEGISVQEVGAAGPLGGGRVGHGRGAASPACAPPSQGAQRDVPPDGVLGDTVASVPRVGGSRSLHTFAGDSGSGQRAHQVSAAWTI